MVKRMLGSIGIAVAVDCPAPDVALGAGLVADVLVGCAVVVVSTGGVQAVRARTVRRAAAGARLCSGVMPDPTAETSSLVRSGANGNVACSL
jgi:hypothetical protein